jgi:hypothetical protein
VKIRKIFFLSFFTIHIDNDLPRIY